MNTPHKEQIKELKVHRAIRQHIRQHLKEKYFNKGRLLKEDNSKDYWAEWAAGEIEAGNDTVGVEFGDASSESMDVFNKYVKVVKTLNADSKELRDDIAAAVSGILYGSGSFEYYDFDILTPDQFNKIKGFVSEGFSDKMKFREEGNKEIPSGWKELNPKEFDGWGDEETTQLKVWSAPMEGWDHHHNDLVVLLKDDESGKYHVDGYLSYGDFEPKGPFESYQEALKSSIEVMEWLKEDWD